MANFNTADQIVRKHEGGYANNPSDRGGETYRGIARKIFPHWKGWATVDKLRKVAGFPANLDKDAELQSFVHDFYKKEFWDAMSLDFVNDQAIANELYDTGVNMGVGTAANFLQRVLNVSNKKGQEYADMPVDGKIGPNTVRTLNNHKRPKEVLKALNCLQGAKYIAICEANPSQEIFFVGWMNRVL